jgi:CheY-like chemotaxis protein
MDGLVVTQLIRALEAKAMGAAKDNAEVIPHTPILAVSSTVVETEKDKYIEAGLNGWIMKPIDCARLNFLLRGVSDHNARKMCTYKPGQWDLGGWF